MAKKVLKSSAKTKITKQVSKLPKVKLGWLAKIFSPLKPVGTYLKGAWAELGQVRWPNRRATWELTIAVIGFSAFFVVFIILLDLLFKYLFKLMLG